MFMTRSLRSLTVAVLVVLGSVSITASPRPVVASTLTITALSCETVHTGLLCDGYVSGGTGGNTYTWNGVTGISYDSPDASTVTLRCETGTTLNVTFQVRDSSGATASKTITKYCSGATP